MARTLLTSAAALALCALATSGCGRHSEEPTPQSITSAQAPAQAEAPDVVSQAPQAPPKDETARIRRAIRDFIAEKYPNSEVEGVWTLAMRGNYCFAGADTVINSRHQNVDVLVRQYVREDGSEYWRGEGFGPDSARMLQLNSTPPSPATDSSN